MPTREEHQMDVTPTDDMREEVLNGGAYVGLAVSEGEAGHEADAEPGAEMGAPLNGGGFAGILPEPELAADPGPPSGAGLGALNERTTPPTIVNEIGAAPSPG